MGLQDSARWTWGEVVLSNRAAARLKLGEWCHAAEDVRRRTPLALSSTGDGLFSAKYTSCGLCSVCDSFMFTASEKPQTRNGVDSSSSGFGIKEARNKPFECQKRLNQQECCEHGFRRTEQKDRAGGDHG